LFLNISLACDFRIVAEDTVFQNPYLDLGLIPKGGSAFFLCRILGHSKACKLLMLGEEIWAEQALTLGMVDEVVAVDRLEERAIEFARRLVQKSAVTLSGIKRLLNYFTKDLKDYLDFENQELMKIVGSSEFSADSPIELRKKLRKNSLSKTKP
jgi:2-(1,2-epoxy-1,2-dihydrophenyl)acetyl-CoA isomerase